MVKKSQSKKLDKHPSISMQRCRTCHAGVAFCSPTKGEPVAVARRVILRIVGGRVRDFRAGAIPEPLRDRFGDLAAIAEHYEVADIPIVTAASIASRERRAMLRFSTNVSPRCKLHSIAARLRSLQEQGRSPKRPLQDELEALAR